MRLLAVFILVGVMFVYAIIGGVIFHYIEISHEGDSKANINSSLFSNIGACLSYDDIVFLKNVGNDMKSAGVFVKKDASTIRYSFWDYRTSVLASIDSLTLVGNPMFGPRTLGGRLFLILYVLIGQFLFYLAYMLCGRLIFSSLTRVWKYCRNSFCRSHLKIEKLMKYILLASIGLIIFMAIPASIFSKIERWEYGRAFYFVFGTLLSIGFYDIPTLNANLDLTDETMQWYRLCYGFWLLITYFWFGGILLAYFVFIIELIHHEAETAGDEIIKDLNVVKNKIRPQIPAPMVTNQYPGYMMQAPNIVYNENVTNIAYR